MVKGEPFEVSKEVYERAKENGDYMTIKDRNVLFSDSILCGYGLYNCRVHEENGKYICTWWRGDSCD